MGKNLVRARILDMCWDSVECHAKEVRAMAREGVSVSNFALAKVSESEKKKLARVMQLRALELKDIRRGSRPGKRGPSVLLDAGRSLAGAGRVSSNSRLLVPDVT